jgi:uncharacterized integral membrane protein (TIGR00698 family)
LFKSSDASKPSSSVKDSVKIPAATTFGSPAYYAALDSMEGIVQSNPVAVPDRWAHFPQSQLLFAIYPGVIVAVTIALASSWLSMHYGAPVMLFALLFGMAFHFLHEEGRCIAGIEFCSRTVLRTGVALLGMRITAGQIVGLGIGPILMVLTGVFTTIAFGTLLGQRLKLGRTFGLLSGGSVAICGASAALAIATVLPAHKDKERDTIVTVVAVTALSTMAMVLYPVLVAALHLDHHHAGIFLGGTIHDVAQVVGAGYMISPETGDIATYIKLLRVATLIPVVLSISYMFGTRSGQASDAASGETSGAVKKRKLPPLPFFLIGFVALVAINSILKPSPFVTDWVTDISSWCLITAIAALGMKTSFKDLVKVGWRPVGLLVAETAWIAGLILLCVEFVL